MLDVAVLDVAVLDVAVLDVAPRMSLLASPESLESESCTE